MLQRHLLNGHTQNKYLRPIGTLFMFKWLPSLISNRSESFIFTGKVENLHAHVNRNLQHANPNLHVL